MQAVGGTERFRYMVGLGYYDEQGIMINSGYKRANLISNLTAQFTPKLRMDTRVYLSYVDRTMNRSSSSGSSKHTRYEGVVCESVAAAYRLACHKGTGGRVEKKSVHWESRIARTIIVQW